MKNTIILLIGLLLISFSFTEDNKAKITDPLSSEDSIVVFCSSDLYILTNTWVREYSLINPDIKFKVTEVSKSDATEYSYSNGKIGFISNEFPEMYKGSGWNTVVGREVIVPVFNSLNPFADEICSQGITTENLALLVKDPGIKNWGSLIGNRDNSPVNIYDRR